MYLALGVVDDAGEMEPDEIEANKLVHVDENGDRLCAWGVLVSSTSPNFRKIGEARKMRGSNNKQQHTNGTKHTGTRYYSWSAA